MEVDREAREAQISALLAEIVAANDNEKSIAGLDILHKLISNILKNPADEKFRVLKKTNKAISAKLMSLQPSGKVMELLLALGYTNIDDDMCAFTGNYFPVLMRGAAQIEEAAMQLKMLFMTPEERKKQELIIQNKKDIIA